MQCYMGAPQAGAAAQYRPAPAGMNMMQPGMPQQVAMPPQPTYGQGASVTRLPSAGGAQQQMVVQAGTMKSMPTAGSAAYQTIGASGSINPATTTTMAASPATQSATQVAMAPGQPSMERRMTNVGQQPLNPQQPAAQQPQASGYAQQVGMQQQSAAGPQPTSSTVQSSTQREQALEKKVRELEALVEAKNREIKDLQTALQRGGRGTSSTDTFRNNGRMGGLKKSTSSPVTHKRSGIPLNGRSPLAAGKPMTAYNALDLEDAVDTRLEEFYNSTNSAIPFRRINRGFYRFGSTICELKIINNKLMACTEDGWNRGHMAPIEKFMSYYEPIERERAGISTD